MSTPLLSVRRVTVHRAHQPIVTDIDLEVYPGEMLVLVGANGSGKSTLVDALAGLIPVHGGRIEMTDQAAPVDLAHVGVRRRAQLMAHLHQDMPAVPGLRVRDLVAHGRYAERGWWSMLRGGYDDTCTRALRDTGTLELADRYVDSLSGGERQRVRLALALAQDTPLLLLDEPTTFLDIAHQLAILQLIDRLRRTRGLTVVAVLHDLEHALHYGDRIAALHHGRLHRVGAGAEVVDEALLAEVFGVRGVIYEQPTTAGARRRVLLEEALSR